MCSSDKLFFCYFFQGAKIKWDQALQGWWEGGGGVREEVEGNLIYSNKIKPALNTPIMRRV